MLKLHFKDHRLPPLWVVEKLYSIGSAPDNQLVIKDEDIDPVHAKVIREDNKFFLKDNNSHSGCFVNGQRITQKEIIPGDILRFGSVEIIVLDPRSLPDKGHNQAPWRLVSDSSWLAGKQFQVPPDKSLVMGRGNQCDIVIPGTHLSRRHAEICVEGNHLRIRDLGSANGTFLNDVQISNATANNGDRLRLDVYSFRIIAPDTDSNKTRLRKPIDELAKPIERKQPSSQPKRWKTRPTSPGNRIEPTYNNSRRGTWLALAAAVLAAIAIVAILLW
ncbi:FHA domain-containing protein [Cellvibrio japonicus]|uniref:FHA domain protein n=1 Tax=Cellvibrio japonicus (strain Ueda107) TaxID=498211 RepID=B3PIA4_CELJU|nr:FHA domain-containing protein [Cellvibrio japonicus]ACE83200.1 FHA domain protein [Cellvibrio japonicus Ueda107]QEI11146.1 FHA domain-containing protein [Cellvibrio japonicus]QEI14720.1 FHA domain-containing protein [Cellvibrio japonicus]QEI18300.1 FHA domain-containing protein [Cellvibrio japonicus]